MSAESDLLTVPEIAERLRVKASWVYGHADELGAFRLGKYLRFSWARVLERLAVRAGCQPCPVPVRVAAQRPAPSPIDRRA